jgi:hypothetical protein
MLCAYVLWWWVVERPVSAATTITTLRRLEAGSGRSTGGFVALATQASTILERDE